MKKILVFYFLVIIGFQAQAFTAEQVIEKANQAYIKEDYTQAIELYEQVVDMGKVASELYYNLANAYFRNNEMGKAILNYERALKLNPGDEMIIHNLEVANKQLVDIIEPVPLIFYERWWRSFLMWLSIDQWAMSGIIGMFFLFGMLSLYFFSSSPTIKKFSFIAFFLFLILSGLAFIAAQKQYNRIQLRDEAIVMVSRTTAKSSPGETSSDVFVIHEGSKVSIENELGEWFEVRVPNGNVGWVNKTTIEII